MFSDFLSLQARAAARYGFLFGGPFLCADWLKSLAQISWCCKDIFLGNISPGSITPPNDHP